MKHVKLNPYFNQAPHHKIHGEAEVQLHGFLTWTQADKQSVSHSGNCTNSTHWTEGLVA